MAEYIEREKIKYEQWSVGPLNEPLNGKCGILCPSCHRREYIVQRDALDTHCGFCGQAIDWGESE